MQGSAAMKHFKIVLKIFLAAIVIGAGCSEDKPVSGIQITNGNCVGKIYNSDGSAANAALVQLIPSNYDPYNRTGGSIDSIYTNSDGGFAFNVSHSDYYNIVAEKSDLSCMQNSVLLQTDAQKNVDNDTLRQSGKLSGVVSLKQGDDCQSVIILILGTNQYMSPSDTSGSFISSLLPQGKYGIRVFTTLAGYTVVDTTIAIIEGVETKLTIQLPSLDAPSVESLSLTFDTTIMYASLNWPMSDTSKIISYVLYRKSKNGNDTSMMIDKSTTTFTEDLVFYEGDTIFYQIGAVGKNYKEGYRTDSRIIVPCAKIECIKKIKTPTQMIYDPTPYSHHIEKLYIDRKENLFIVQDGHIEKLDSNGALLATYETIFSDNFSNMQGDNFGNFYLLNNSAPLSILKFDADLKLQKEIKITDNDYGYLLAVSGNGTIFLVSDSVTPSHRFPLCDFTVHVRTFDSNLSIINEFCRSATTDFLNIIRSGDTIITVGECQSNQRTVGFYDTAFTSLGSCNNVHFLTKYIPSSCKFYNEFYGGPNGIIFAFADHVIQDGTFDYSILLVADRTGNIIARMKFNYSGDFSEYEYQKALFFDHAGDFYCFTKHETDTKTLSLLKYSSQRIYQ
jgi:hypothetical protein